MTRYYIQFGNNSAVLIETESFLHYQKHNPTVAHLILAFKQAISPRLDAIPIDDIFLSLPNGVSRENHKSKILLTLLIQMHLVPLG